MCITQLYAGPRSTCTILKLTCEVDLDLRNKSINSGAPGRLVATHCCGQHDWTRTTRLKQNDKTEPEWRQVPLPALLLAVLGVVLPMTLVAVALLASKPFT